MRYHRNHSNVSETLVYDQDERLINLSNHDITKINYDHSFFTTECAFIETLDLSNNKLEAVNLDWLKGMGPLKLVTLQSNMLRKFWFSWVTAQHLQYLNLIGNELDEFSYPALSACRLEGLQLAWNNLRHFDLEPLRPCKSMKGLDLSHNELTQLDLSPVEDWPDLTHLLLNDNPLTSIDLSPLSHCTNLQYLTLNIYHAGSVDLQPLSSCTKLKGLLLQIEDTKQVKKTPQWNGYGPEIMIETVQNPKERHLFYVYFPHFFHYPHMSLPPRKERRPISGKISHATVSLPAGPRTQDFVDLTYYTKRFDRKEESMRINKGIVELNLPNMRISHLDLSILNELPHLKKVNLSRNELRTVDLRPIEQPSLVSLDLSGNPLQGVDLTPLIRHRDLNSLDLYCPSLEKSILDVTPLLHCSNLQKLVVPSNTRLVCYYDLALVSAPWTGMYEKRIESFSQVEYWIDSLWLFLKEQMMYLKEIQKIDVRFGLLRSFRLTSFGAIDLDIVSVFYRAGVPAARRSNPPPLGVTLKEIILEEARKHLESGNSSIMMSLSDLKASPLADLVSSIAQKREEEMASVVIPKEDGKYDLRYLWLTGKGFELLHSHDFRLETDEAGFLELSKILEPLDASSMIAKANAKNDSSLPDSLVEYIWKVVERGVVRQAIPL